MRARAPSQNGVRVRSTSRRSPSRRIRSQGKGHHGSRESCANDQFQGIDELGVRASWEPPFAEDQPAGPTEVALRRSPNRLGPGGTHWQRGPVAAPAMISPG
jgi:hypothetical protein